MPSDQDQSDQRLNMGPLAPDERLAGLGSIFRDRNQTYGDSFLQFGPVVAAIFPQGLTLKTAEEWNRFALFFMCAVKLHRYGMKFGSGGQADSLDDISVYAQMLAYVDELKGASN